MKTNESKKNNKFQYFLASLVLVGMACRIFPEATLPAPEILVSTEAAGTLEQNVEDAIQQARLTGIFELILTEEQITSYVAIKLQDQENYLITNLQLFLRDGIIQAFAEIEQSSIILPLEFEVEPQIVADGLPQLIVTSAKVAGIAAPDALVQVIQQVIDQAYADMLQDAGTNFTAESITIADGLMTIRGQMK